jgi:hypothetical protein
MTSFICISNLPKFGPKVSSQIGWRLTARQAQPGCLKAAWQGWPNLKTTERGLSKSFNAFQKFFCLVFCE